MAEAALPFLLDRKIAMEVMFGKMTMYQRHPKDEQNKWFYVRTVEDIKDWANRHMWSFHPHLEGNNDWWHIADIDGRTKGLTHDIMKQVALHMASVFDELGLKYLVKFSGDRGFHFLWRWDMSGASLRGKDKWDMAKALTVKYAGLLNDRLAGDAILCEKLRAIVGDKCELTITNSQDPNCSRSVLVDANILHENGNIRSPFSVHPKTSLVSVPVNGVDGIETFEIGDAEREKVVGGKWNWVKLPENAWPA